MQQVIQVFYVSRTFTYCTQHTYCRNDTSVISSSSLHSSVHCTDLHHTPTHHNNTPPHTHTHTHTHTRFRKTTLALSHQHTNLHLISSPSATLLLCLMDRVTWFPKKKRCSGEHSPWPHSALKFSIFTANLVQSEGLVSLFSVDLRPLSCRSVFDCSQER